MATNMTDSACDLERLTEMVFQTQPRQEGTSPKFEFEAVAVAGNNEADLVHLRHYAKRRWPKNVNQLMIYSSLKFDSASGIRIVYLHIVLA